MIGRGGGSALISSSFYQERELDLNHPLEIVRAKSAYDQLFLSACEPLCLNPSFPTEHSGSCSHRTEVDVRVAQSDVCFAWITWRPIFLGGNHYVFAI